jgi:hypothetical protein
MLDATIKHWRGMNPKYSRGFICFAVSFLLIVPIIAFSVSFGAFVKKDVIALGRGESGVFEVLFYSQDDDAVEFILSLAETPTGFEIDYPRNFDLNSAQLKEEYVVISGEYARGRVVVVDVSVPNDVAAGEHRILLNAVTSNEDSGGMLDVNAEKTFLLKVIVDGSEEEDVGTTGTTQATQTTTLKETADEENEGAEEQAGDGSNKFLVLVAFVLMVVFLILVYLNYKSHRSDSSWGKS